MESNIFVETMPTEKMSRNELILMCKQKNIKGYHGKKKDEIIRMIEMCAQKNNVPQNTIRYIDLFCGLGAFHCALNTSPHFKCVLACDIDEGVRNIYKANYNLEPEKDIRNINIQEMPDFEILCAGFPCQPFSIAGNGEGFHDKEKGNLFYDILKIIDGKTPQMCILENVKNLKTHDNGNTYNTIETELKKRGYLITSKVINSAEYGSPQARQRIFIVATKEKPFVIPEGCNTPTPVSSIIDSTIHKNDIDLNKYDLKKKKVEHKKVNKPIILYDIVSKTTGKGGRQGERVYSTESTGITICASSGGPGAKTGLYKVGDTIRRLTVKETLQMFGFPVTYNFLSTSYEDSLFYLGNSIVVNVLTHFVPIVEAWFQEE